MMIFEFQVNNRETFTIEYNRLNILEAIVRNLDLYYDPELAYMFAEETFKMDYDDCKVFYHNDNYLKITKKNIVKENSIVGS